MNVPSGIEHNYLATVKIVLCDFMHINVFKCHAILYMQTEMVSSEFITNADRRINILHQATAPNE